MLGEKIGDSAGKISTRRVLGNSGSGPQVETSFATTGFLLGTEYREIGTYTAVMRPDGTLFGQGNGLLLGRDGDSATWTGQGVGTIKSGGAVSYRGAIYFQTTSPKWSRLNSVAGVFEFEADADGNTKTQTWEWK